jgi:hypothetical protein
MSRIYQEHLHGLVTILTFVTFHGLKPYFMLKTLMGFSSQSFIPDLKH